MYTRQVITTEIEQKIVTGIIVDTQFCRDVLKIIKLDYFTIDYVKPIITWVKKYYKRFEEAPGKHIQDIFTSQKEYISSERAELIQEFLMQLSKNYEEESEFNSAYLFEEAKGFCKQKSLMLLSSNISGLTLDGKYEDAEKAVADYKEVVKSTSNWVNPLDGVFMKEVFAKVKKDPLLQYPGKLGQLIGPFERGYLVGIMGPYKRGKTWHLMEIAVLGILNNLNVLFISLEMGKEQVSQRLYKRLTSFGETPGEYRYPCFDCHKNQVGTCQLPERASSNDLYTMGSEPPEFEDVTFEYTPCTYCRKHHLQEYEPATWYVTDERNGFSFDTVSKNVSTVPNKLRVMCYAAYSATLNDLKRDIELLEYTEGFIPDIIVTDYADIFAPDDSRLLGRELLDSIWKIHKQIAASLNCLVVTGSQTNKKSADAKNVNSTDVAEDYRKLAHVDKMIMISQTSVEKDRGVQRLSCINRHEESNEHKQVLVLNNFNLGQVVLDSEYRKKKKST